MTQQGSAHALAQSAAEAAQDSSNLIAPAAKGKQQQATKGAGAAISEMATTAATAAFAQAAATGTSFMSKQQMKNSIQ